VLKRSRVGSTIDMGRLSKAVSRPGIDPRVWVSLAVAESDTFVDPAHGVFIDVLLLPTLERYTARVPADYVGKGFGFYTPIHKQDDLLIGIPSGDSAEGCVVLERLYSASDTPPKDAQDHPKDVLLHVEKDQNLRIRMEGGGTINIIVADGKINLGKEDLSDDALVAIAKLVKQEISTLRDTVNSNVSIFNAHVHSVAAAPGPAAPTLTLETAPVSVGEVKAKNVRAEV